MNRADEFDGFAVRSLVGHHFGDGQVVRGFFDGFLQCACKRDAACGEVVEQAVVFAVFGNFECGDVDVGDVHGRQFFLQRCGGFAIGIEGDGDRQDFLADRLVRRDVTDLCDGHGQAARGGINGFFRFGGEEVVLSEACFDGACEGFGQLGQCLGGQFFGQQFDKQCLVHG